MIIIDHEDGTITYTCDLCGKECNRIEIINGIHMCEECIKRNFAEGISE